MKLGYAVILGFVGFVTSFGAHIVAVNLPVYAKQVGVGVEMIGLLIAVYDLAEIVAKPTFGAIADRAGMKRTMLLGILVFIASSLAYLWSRPQLLLLIRFLQGVGAAALSSVSLALIAIYYKETRGRAYGIYNTIKGAGYVVSPLVGGALLVRKSFGHLFIASAAVGVVAFLASLFLPDVKENARPFEDEEELSLQSLLSVFRTPILWRWYLIIVVNMFFVSILFGFVPVYLYSLGYKPEIAGVFLSGLALSYLLVQPFAGWLADKYKARTTVLWGIAVSALTLALIPFCQGRAARIHFRRRWTRNRDGLDEQRYRSVFAGQGRKSRRNDGSCGIVQGVWGHGGPRSDRDCVPSVWADPWLYCLCCARSTVFRFVGVPKGIKPFNETSGCDDT